MRILNFKKKIAIIAFILLIYGGYNANAQHFLERSEIGFTLGGTTYMGDLNNMSVLGTVSPAGGILFRYTIDPRWVIKANAIYGTLKGGKPDNIKERNLSFQSHVFETSLQVEFNFLPYLTGNSRNKWAPYIFAGVGAFSFSPKAEYNGIWYELSKLGTEGQGSIAYPDRKPYSLVQLAIPFGVGFKFSISNSIGLGIEYGFRKTFTDYIDDASTTYVGKDVLLSTNGSMSYILSDRTNELKDHAGEYNVAGTQRGNSALDDWYTFFGVNMTFKLDFLVPGKNCQHSTFKYYNSRKRYPTL